jgi:hypothetical protein
MPNVVVQNDDGEMLEHYFENGTALTSALHRVQPHETELLRWVDPYTDTVFNVKQVAALKQDLELVLVRCQSPAEREAVECVIRLTEAVRYHRYLVFVGD